MWALFILGISAASGEARPVAEIIANGKAALDTLDYDAAAQELGLAAADPRATPAERIDANLWAGVANRVLGRDTEARLNFVYVLTQEQNATLPPGLPPKITGFFALIQTELAAQRATEQPAPATAAAPASAGPIGPALMVGGGALSLIGGAALVAAGLVWTDFADAQADLKAAAALRDDGTNAQARQRAARDAWESWGSAAAVGGGVLAASGVLVVAVGGTFLMGLFE